MDFDTLSDLIASHVPDEDARDGIISGVRHYGTLRGAEAIANYRAACARSEQRMLLREALAAVERAQEEPHLGYLRNHAIERAAYKAERAGCRAAVAALGDSEEEAPLIDGVRAYDDGPDLALAVRHLEAAIAAIPY